MKLSEIQPSVDLMNLLKEKGVTTTIYAKRDRPTASLPETFIDIQNNGAAINLASQRGFVQQALALTINVKLQTNGAANTIKENNILKQIEDLFSTTVEYGLSRFTLSPNLIAEGTSQSAGYSYRMLSFNVDIYKN